MQIDRIHRIAQHKTRRAGLVLFEMIVVVMMLSFLYGVAMLNFTGAIGKSKFDTHTTEFVNTLQLAHESARKTGMRYAVVLDFVEQTYTLEEFSPPDMEEFGEAPAILKQGYFTEEFQLISILADNWERADVDEENTSELTATFVAGKNGWQRGGKIVVMDEDGNDYSIILNRLTSDIKIFEGDDDFYLLGPIPAQEMIW